MLDVATAFSLSGAAGLNAWIPLLTAGLLDRAGQLQLAEPYDALATTPGLIVLGVFFVLDFFGDKVPAVDHVLHAIGSVVHPASGAILFAGEPFWGYDRLALLEQRLEEAGLAIDHKVTAA